MEKKFKKMKDYLEVVVTGGNEINLPDGKETVCIGSLTQRQVQKIDLDKVPVLVKFIKDQVESGDAQLVAMNSQLRDLDNVQEIDEKVVEECKSRLVNGTQGFKSKMSALNKHIGKIEKVKQLTNQIEYMTKQLDPMKTELTDIEEAMK